MDRPLTKAEMYYGWDRPEPPPFVPHYNREVADKLVVVFRTYIAESRERNKGCDCPLHWKSLDKLERLTNQMEIDGWIK